MGGDLVQKLVESMLPVGARLSPDDGPRRLVGVRPRQRAALRTAPHREFPNPVHRAAALSVSEPYTIPDPYERVD